MGLFSAECEGCHHPALCYNAANETNRWMTQVVAIMPGGQLYTGEYDGYGRVGGAEDAVGWDSTVWHKACWEVAGRPTGYTGASKHAEDQGWFFDDGDHDMPEPTPPAPPEERQMVKFTRSMETASGQTIEISNGPNGGRKLTIRNKDGNEVTAVLTAEEWSDFKAEI